VGNTGKRVAKKGSTNSPANAGASPRRSRYLGVDEARVVFLEAVKEWVPEVFQDLAGVPFMRCRKWARLLAEKIPETEPAAEWTAHLRAAEQAREAAIGEWQGRWSLRAPWCGERATELLEEWEGGLVPYGAVDFITDVSRREGHVPVRLDLHPNESEGEWLKRKMRDFRRAVRRWARTTRLEARGATWQEQRRHFAWAARWQCAGETYPAIADAAGVNVAAVEDAVRSLLDFIGLEHASDHRRGPGKN